MIEDVKTVDSPSEPAATAPSETPQATPEPGRKPRKTRTRASDRAGGSLDPPPHAGGGWGPEEVIAEGPGAGMTRSQVIAKWGEEMGQRMLDAAAGRKPPYTRDIAGTDPAPASEEVTSRHQDRGPIHLLPRPVEFNMKPDSFFKYWAMLSQDERKRTSVRPYRLWPKTDVMLLLPPEEREKVIRNVRKPPTKTLPPGPLAEPFDPQNWRAEIYHRYGSGDYNFILTDTHPAVNRKICMTNVVGELRDMDTYPPVVDMRTLVVSDPGNESYIRWCNTKGIKVPGRDGEGREEEDMASTKILADTVRDLAKGTGHAPNADPGGALKALGDTMIKTAEANNTILTKSMDSQIKLIETRANQLTAPPAPPPPPQQNIDGVIKMVLDSNEKRDQAYREASEKTAAAQREAAEKASTAQAEANKQVMALILGNQQALEKRLEAAESRAAQLQSDMIKLITTQSKPAESSNPLTAKSPMDMFGEISKMMTGVLNFVDKVSDRGGSRGGDSGSIWSRIAEKVVDVAPNVMYNYSLAQRAAAAVRGASLPEPQAPGQPGEEVEVDENAPPSEEELAMQFLDQIERPLCHALTTGATGQEFGALMMKTFGADTYEFIAGQSDDALFQLLKNNLNIWGTVQKMPQRFVAFLAEFRDRVLVSQIFQRMNAMATAPLAQPAARVHAMPSATPTPPAPSPAQPVQPAAAPVAAAPGGAPAQVTRKLKPGQRVVHTPSGQRVVDATATTVPEEVSPPSPPPASPASPSQATA